jgi:hypothetical protein
MHPNAEQLVALHGGDVGSLQDAAHELLFSLRSNDHKTVVLTNGAIYEIGPEPEGGRRFGLGFGGQRWTVFFHDGTVVQTRNLWHAGSLSDYALDVRCPANAVLMQAPFWGNNLRVPGVEHLLQPAPVGSPNREVFGVLDTRESLTVRMEREKRAWAARPLWMKVWYADMRPLGSRENGFAPRAEARLVQVARIQSHRLSRAVRGVVNLFICTGCWHLRKRHWVAGDRDAEYDWGCGIPGCDC